MATIQADLSESARIPFPQTPEEFQIDLRVSFSTINQKFTLEAEDGQEYEYDDALKRWILVLDNALLEQQGEAYAVQGVDESEPALQPKRKRKQAYTNGEDEEGGRLVPSKKPKPATEAREPKNTAVYITNLPLDTDVEEVHSVFSRCGVITESIDEGKPRINLYKDEQGNLKGDAVVVYFRAESVDLAVKLLDDTDFRLGQSASGGKMKVMAAERSYKSQKDPSVKSSGKDKKKIIKKTQKLNNKLADWDDDDPSAIQDTTSRWDKVVILKHMFTLDELEEDPAAILDIKEDIRDECAKLGHVTNVVLYDQEPDGVATVRYSYAENARRCVEMMDGRFFSGTQVIATISTGSERFKKSNEKKLGIEIDEVEGANKDEEEGKRLDKFGKWLEEGEQEGEEEDEM